MLYVRSVRGVPIYAHWSVPAICLFLLGAGSPRILMTVAALTAYLAILVVHELGHHFVAERRGYRVDRIEIFLFHAFCHHEGAEYPLDEAYIAWGGPLAQFLLAIPFTAYATMAGFTHSQVANAFIGMLGYYNPIIALLNLAPFEGLDGTKAWRILRVKSEADQRYTPTPRSAVDVFEELRKEAIRKANKS